MNSYTDKNKIYYLKNPITTLNLSSTNFLLCNNNQYLENFHCNNITNELQIYIS